MKPAKYCQFCSGLIPRNAINYRKRKFCSMACDKANIRAQSEQRFWARVDKSGGPDACWLWQGYCQKFGHGWLQRCQGSGTKPKGYLAHRFAYELLVGPVPDGKCLLHHCDNPPCVNPAHLFIGDRDDNAKDSMAKRRHTFGVKNKHAKLNDAKVQAIRAEYWYRDGRSNSVELAEKYGVRVVTIGAIIAGRTWRHLPHTPIKPRSKQLPQSHEGET
jgi:hypothetical protein